MMAMSAERSARLAADRERRAALRRKPGACALWYSSYHSPYYEICDDEREAAGRAWGIADSGTGAVLGVQFPDGRLIEADAWPLLEQVTREYEEAGRGERQRPRGQPPQRKIRDPFRHWELSVDASEPGWVGQPAEAER